MGPEYVLWWGAGATEFYQHERSRVFGSVYEATQFAKSVRLLSGVLTRIADEPGPALQWEWWGFPDNEFRPLVK